MTLALVPVFTGFYYSYHQTLLSLSGSLFFVILFSAATLIKSVKKTISPFGSAETQDCAATNSNYTWDHCTKSRTIVFPCNQSHP